MQLPQRCATPLGHHGGPVRRPALVRPSLAGRASTARGVAVLARAPRGDSTPPLHLAVDVGHHVLVHVEDLAGLVREAVDDGLQLGFLRGGFRGGVIFGDPGGGFCGDGDGLWRCDFEAATGGCAGELFAEAEDFGEVGGVAGGGGGEGGV